MFVSMGGFMAASAPAVIAGNKNRRKQEKSDSIKAAQAESRAQMTELNQFVAGQDAKRTAARQTAELKLGRPETRDERVDRECAQFGFSMG